MLKSECPTIHVDVRSKHLVTSSRIHEGKIFLGSANPTTMPSLLLLTPRPPGRESAAFNELITKEHTAEDWESHRQVIEHLYINEDRRLIDTMTIMVSRHGFAATEQMYKKRLKKWNIRKRSYRKSAKGQAISTPPKNLCIDGSDKQPAESRCANLNQDYSSMVVMAPAMKRLIPYAGLELVLDNVRSWSLCKLEMPGVVMDPMVKYLANPSQPPIQDSRTMYRTFELVFDLWHYGKGQLAGMAARKAFYILEFVLMEDHPDLLWHILDTIYDMIDRGHLQLLGMFLRHASVLSAARLPQEHPLVAILQQLIECDYQTQQGREYVCHLLQLAWLQNVDLLSDKVGSLASKYLWLYEQLIWDGRTRLRKGCKLARKKETMIAALYNMLRQNMDSTGCDVDRLRIMALMLEYTQMDLEHREKAEALALELLDYTRQGTGESRSDARFHAYACKMLARLQQHRQDWEQAEANLKYAIEKREAAHGTGSDLRVIRDMWVLAQHYQRAGRESVANQIIQDAISRAEALLTPFVR